MADDERPAPIRTRVSDLLGVDYPIIQAPMGWIARAQLASAVSNAGGLGIIETSSGELDNVRAEITKMRDLTDKPFGVNIAQMTVGREEPGGEAVGILNLDNRPSAEALQEVADNPAIISVKVIELPAAGYLPAWLLGSSAG